MAKGEPGDKQTSLDGLLIRFFGWHSQHGYYFISAKEILVVCLPAAAAAAGSVCAMEMRKESAGECVWRASSALLAAAQSMQQFFS